MDSLTRYVCKAVCLHTAYRLRLLPERIVSALAGKKLPLNFQWAYNTIGRRKTDVRILRKDEYSADIAKTDRQGHIASAPFKILSSTDFHYRYDDPADPAPDIKATETFLRHVRERQPDLIVLTGDIVLGSHQFLDSCRFARMMASLGIPWVFVIGNHELGVGKDFSRFLQVWIFAHSKGCLTRIGKKNLYGFGNFVINLIGADGKPYQKLFCFDSGDWMMSAYNREHGFPEDLRGYDYLKKDQIDFYKSELDAAFEQFGPVKSMMFMHIPLPEYGLFFDETEKDTYAFNGRGEYFYGEQHESVGCAPVNSGMFEAIEQYGSTVAVFAGHDHINDWCVEYRGVKLLYSQPGGYTAYHLGTARGLPESHWQQGVTETTVSPDGSVEIKPYYNRVFL